MKVLKFAAFYGLIWWALTDGSTYQWVLGAAVVGLAVFCEYRIPVRPTGSPALRINALLHFIPYFAYQSIKGGLTVAKLAFSPQRKIHSEYFEYPTCLPREDELARMCFAACLCVFPGTLSCGYRENRLVIHALDVGLIDMKAVKDLEKITAEMFGFRWASAGRPAICPE